MIPDRGDALKAKPFPSNSNAMNLTGQRYGRLTVRGFYDFEKKGRPLFVCDCDCGNATISRSYTLRRGAKKSCGCLLPDVNRATKTTHGHAVKGARTPTYRSWESMQTRCNNGDNPSYGGRGIKVCPRWSEGEGDKTGFECFLEDMGERPSLEYSIDRYPDNDGNYEPGNCRWATDKEQALNRGNTIRVELNGTVIPLLTACEKLGIDYENTAVRMYRYGFSFDRAISQRTIKRPRK